MPANAGGGRIPSGVLVALALAILLAGFLLGRRSTPEVAPPSPSPIATLAAAPPTVAPAEPTAEPPPTFAASMPTLAVELPPATPPPVEVQVPAPHANDREEIARYFADADAIQARAKYWSDPQALAKSILQQASGGNAGAFDELIATQANARRELERLVVPAACSEHHRRSLAVMAEGIELLAQVRNALQSSDLGSLDGLQERARALEREAKEVDELGKSLQQR